MSHRLLNRNQRYNPHLDARRRLPPVARPQINSTLPFHQINDDGHIALFIKNLPSCGLNLQLVPASPTYKSKGKAIVHVNNLVLGDSKLNKMVRPSAEPNNAPAKPTSLTQRATPTVPREVPVSTEFANLPTMVILESAPSTATPTTTASTDVTMDDKTSLEEFSHLLNDA